MQHVGGSVDALSIQIIKVDTEEQKIVDICYDKRAKKIHFLYFEIEE